MNMLASGSITSPVANIDIAIPALPSLLLLRRIAMQSMPEGLCALFSEDGGLTFAEMDYAFDRVSDAEHGDNQISMPLIRASNGVDHHIDVDIDPHWALIRSRAIVVTSSSMLEEALLSRLIAYNVDQTHSRIKGADGGNIASGNWYLYGLPA
jgi:hypothetical protein